MIIYILLFYFSNRLINPIELLNISNSLFKLCLLKVLSVTVTDNKLSVSSIPAYCINVLLQLKKYSDTMTKVILIDKQQYI